jgi:hypothetical protein
MVHFLFMYCMLIEAGQNSKQNEHDDHSASLFSDFVDL